jgi:hypothetical protein
MALFRARLMSIFAICVFELVISETLSWLNFVQIITCTGQYCTSHNLYFCVVSVDRGPADERNIKGVVMNVNEHGGYKIGTKVGQIKGYMSRNQIQFVAKRGFMQEGVMAIPASLTQLNSMTMISVSNSIVGSLLSVELCAVN